MEPTFQLKELVLSIPAARYCAAGQVDAAFRRRGSTLTRGSAMGSEVQRIESGCCNGTPEGPNSAPLVCTSTICAVCSQVDPLTPERHTHLSASASHRPFLVPATLPQHSSAGWVHVRVAGGMGPASDDCAQKDGSTSMNE